MTRIAIMSLAALAMGWIVGCEKALFPPNAPRSQYERFQYQREGFTPEQQETLFGEKEIDLRSRLKPLGSKI